MDFESLHGKDRCLPSSTFSFNLMQVSKFVVIKLEFQTIHRIELFVIFDKGHTQSYVTFLSLVIISLHYERYPLIVLFWFPKRMISHFLLLHSIKFSAVPVDYPPES